MPALGALDPLDPIMIDGRDQAPAGGCATVRAERATPDPARAGGNGHELIGGIRDARI